MHNPTTIDRRDVAHCNNPIGEQGYAGELFSFSEPTLAEGAAGHRTAEVRSEGRRPVYAGNTRSAH